MKKLFLICFASMFCWLSAHAAPATDRRALYAPRVGMVGTVITPAAQTTGSLAVTPSVYMPASTQVKDMREEEKQACLNMMNQQIGNTFVWASQQSAVGGYAMMKEDMDNPANNFCFVKIDLKSSDPEIRLPDKPMYQKLGQIINCGSWASESDIEKIILDAKKGKRVGAAIGVGVASGAVGFGAMELFGNKLIGGKVEGQKGMSPDELLKSQIAVLKKDNPSGYQSFRGYLQNLKAACEEDIWKTAADKKPDECNRIDYDGLLKV